MKKTIVAFVVACAMAFMFAGCAANPEADLSKPYEKLLKEVKAPTDSSLAVLTVVTSPDFSPMEFSDLAKSGAEAYVGFDILLANYIAKELNMQLLIKPMSFDACMAAVQADSADLAISGFSWTAARAETFLISDYYIAGENETEQTVITTVANKDAFKSVADYSGKKVGAQGGSLQELLVSEQLVPQGAELVKMENLNDLVTALKNGQIDALAVADGNGDAFIAADPDSVSGTGFMFELDEKYKNNVILLNKADAELCAKVNEALAKALAADVYDSWYEASVIYAGISTLDELGYDDEGNKITE